ncbi:hypothetical protein FQR65_LT03859 [Abscondita terminalis]|nr:hypothetical protein FQR65_LT03859 [Abscondita terminalis]
MLKKSLALLFFIFIEDGYGMFVGMDKVVQIDKFTGKCPEFKYLPIVYQTMSISPNLEGELLMNTTIIVNEDISGPLRAEMKIERCEKKGDHCELLHTIKHRRYCDMIQSDTDLTWKQFFQAIEPKWKCPFKKGTYKAVNAAFDISSFLLMAGDQSYWKIRSETFDSTTDKTVLCIIGEAHVYSA